MNRGTFQISARLRKHNIRSPCDAKIACMPEAGKSRVLAIVRSGSAATATWRPGWSVFYAAWARPAAQLSRPDPGSKNCRLKSCGQTLACLGPDSTPVALSGPVLTDVLLRETTLVLQALPLVYKDKKQKEGDSSAKRRDRLADRHGRILYSSQYVLHILRYCIKLCEPSVGALLRDENRRVPR